MPARRRPGDARRRARGDAATACADHAVRDGRGLVVEPPESIHRASWPRVDEIEVDGDPRLLADIAAALVEIPRRQVAGQGVDEDRGDRGAHLRTGSRAGSATRPSKPICGPSSGSPAN